MFLYLEERSRSCRSPGGCESAGPVSILDSTNHKNISANQTAEFSASSHPRNGRADQLFASPFARAIVDGNTGTVSNFLRLQKLLTVSELQRKYLCFGNDFLDLLHQMGVAGEKQNLMRGTKLAERVECIAAAIGIEVDKNVIEHNRQRIDVVCVFADQRQPHRQIELFGGPAAQNLRRKARAIGAFDLDFTAVQRGNHAHVTAFGHKTEERRSLPQHFRLAFGFIDLARFVQKRPAQGNDGPLFGSLIDARQYGFLAG